MLRSWERRLDKIEAKIKAGATARFDFFDGFDEACNSFDQNLVEVMAEFGVEEFSDEYEEKEFSRGAHSFCRAVAGEYHRDEDSLLNDQIERVDALMSLMIAALVDKEVLREYVRTWKFLKEHSPEVFKHHNWLEKGEIFFEKEKAFAMRWKPDLKS